MKDRDGTSIYCDCCHQEKLLEVHPRQGIEVVDGRHGRKHIATLGPRETLERLSGTMNGSAILHWVEGVLQ